MGCQSSTTLVSIQNDGPFTTPTKMNREELQKQLEMIDKVPGYQNALDKNNVEKKKNASGSSFIFRKEVLLSPNVFGI